MKVQIAPSLLACDFARLADEIRRVEDAGADLLHLDVMDGHFVRNLTIGPPVVERIRRASRVPLDCHLMIMEPDRYVDDFLSAGADSVTIHAEAVAFDYAREWRDMGYRMNLVCKKLIDDARVARVAERVRAAGKRLGVALNPDTGAEVLADTPHRFDMILAMTVWPGFGGQKFIESVLPKIAALRDKHPTTDIQVDGGLDPRTVGRAAAAGANVIVAGTSVFRARDAREAMEALRGGAAAAVR